MYVGVQDSCAPDGIGKQPLKCNMPAMCRCLYRLRGRMREARYGSLPEVRGYVQRVRRRMYVDDSGIAGQLNSNVTVRNKNYDDGKTKSEDTGGSKRCLQP